MNLRKLIASSLGVILVMALIACGSADDLNSELPNPFTEHETLADAEKEVGFSFSIPDTIQSFNECEYRSDKDDNMLEVIFRNGDEEIRFRKAAGEGDISGNYTKYSEREDVEVDGAAVTMQGEGGKVNLAVWSADGYAYSIDCTVAVNDVTMTVYMRATMPIESDALKEN